MKDLILTLVEEVTPKLGDRVSWRVPSVGVYQGVFLMVSKGDWIVVTESMAGQDRYRDRTLTRKLADRALLVQRVPPDIMNTVEGPSKNKKAAGWLKKLESGDGIETREFFKKGRWAVEVTDASYGDEVIWELKIVDTRTAQRVLRKSFKTRSAAIAAGKAYGDA